MRALAALPVLLLCTACAAVSVDYKASAAQGDPKKIVERVLYEQPSNKRPEYINISDTFIEFGDGVAGSSVSVTGVSASHTFRKNVTRLYYRTIAEAALLSRVSPKGHWYVVEPRAANGRTLAQVYVDQRDDAEKLVDALMALKAAAPATD